MIDIQLLDKNNKVEEWVKTIITNPYTNLKKQNKALKKALEPYGVILNWLRDQLGNPYLELWIFLSNKNTDEDVFLYRIEW